MPTSKSRVRTRYDPLKAGTVKLGYFQSRSNINQPWGSPGPDTTYGGLTSLGHFGYKVERTWDETHGRPPYKTGGPFQSIKIVSCEPLSPVVRSGTYVRGDNLQRYVGGFKPPDNSDFGLGFDILPNNYLGYDSPLVPDLSGSGDAAYAKLRPQLEQVGGAVAFAELRDLPGMLKTSSRVFHDVWKSMKGSTFTRIMSPRKAADHFLNHQFGWVPFLKDMKGFYNTFQNYDQIARKISEQNGQWVRKRASISKSASPWTGIASASGNRLFPNTSLDGSLWCNGGPFWWLGERTVTHVTASGKFRYYRPEFDLTREDNSSSMREIQRQLTLYGFRISPSNIYKATPWTWAVDWISNFGKLVDRANDVLVDSVASQYLFVSQHTVKERIFLQFIPFKTGHVTLAFRRYYDIKQRREASSPYGFNLSVSNLTARQIAIAGALGITFRR